MELVPMDYVRGALCNAIAEGLTVRDLYAMAEHAETCERFDNAVNELASASPGCLDVDLALALMYPK